jgi:hypothetical protein
MMNLILPPTIEEGKEANQEVVREVIPETEKGMTDITTRIMKEGVMRGIQIQFFTFK